MPAIAKREMRFFKGLEAREAKSDGAIGTIGGYAAVFETWSQELGWFFEKIRKGAFKESLARGDDVRALVDHDTALIIGRRSARTLTLSEDEKGLKVEISVPDTTAGRDVFTSVKRGDLTGMSFGFDVVDDVWTNATEDGKTVYRRELITLDLFEVSIVAFPAYDEASAEARSMRSAKDVFEAAKVKMDGARFATRDRKIRAYQARRAMWN